MKLTIGLLIFICMAAVTIHLAATKKIDAVMAAVLLTFAIGAAFVTANYDIISKAKISKDGLELETAINKLNKLKDSSI
jgi:heme/copper-type cytochrome/quinol oxidase subunit 3